MLKTVSSITNAIGALNYKGTWDANANSPALASSVGTKGDYYVVGTAGSTNLNGISNWGVGDLATFNGSVWQRVEGGADLNGVNLSVSGTTTLSGLTASTSLALDANKNVISVTKPIAQAYQSSAQTLTSATFALIQHQTELFDTAGCFNNTASPVTLNGLTAPAYSFTPNVAGWYQVSAGLTMGSLASAVTIALYKNGSIAKLLSLTEPGTTLYGSYGSGLIYLNGTGDYIQIYGRLSVGQALEAFAQSTYFDIAFVG